MSIPNNSLPSFFTNLSPHYPSITEDGKINTQQFLEASKSFIKIYGKKMVLEMREPEIYVHYVVKH